MSTPLASEIVSAVSFSSRSFRFGAVAKMPGDEVERLRSLHRARRQDRKRAALAWRKRVAMVDAARDIGRQDGHRAGFAASTSDDSPELLNRLQRLALAPCEAVEDGSLVVGQFLADDGDQESAPSGPAIAGEQSAEIAFALQRLAHGDELAEIHGATLRWIGREKCSASGLGLSDGAAFRPSSLSASLTALFSPPCVRLSCAVQSPDAIFSSSNSSCSIASSGAPDEQALRERGFPSDASDEFGFDPAKEPALPATAVNGVAHRSTGERRAVRTNLGARRR